VAAPSGGSRLTELEPDVGAHAYGTKKVDGLLMETWTMPIMDGPVMNALDLLELPAQAIRWLGWLVSRMPETVQFQLEVSGVLLPL
jgi:ABC-type uncharacterized transport system permease subunit